MIPQIIVIHCSATKENQDVSAETIDKWHADRGFKRSNPTNNLKHIGYQYYIRKDGTVIKGREENEVGAHAKGYNSKSIGICYEGGLDNNGKPKDTRTEAQKRAINNLMDDICGRWDIMDIVGHRDLSPDLNGDGIITPNEWIKVCPCFEVKEDFPTFMDPVIVNP